MTANSIAPSSRSLDIYKDGSDWKAALHVADGTTQITSATIGTVAVGATSIVTFPLDLRAMGGDAAHEIRCVGAGTIKVRHAKPLNASFPVAALAVVDGEVIGQQVESIVDPGALTRIRIAWG
jgi:hypothetical protein